MTLFTYAGFDALSRMSYPKKVPYGTLVLCQTWGLHLTSAVRLGNSGLKVSKIILGCMSYGSPDWQGWVLPEKESIEHIKHA